MFIFKILPLKLFNLPNYHCMYSYFYLTDEILEIYESDFFHNQMMESSQVYIGTQIF